QRNLVFAAKDSADIDKCSARNLAKSCGDFVFLHGCEQKLTRVCELAAFDRIEQMTVNGAAHKTACARNLLDGFAGPEIAAMSRLGCHSNAADDTCLTE